MASGNYSPEVQAVLDAWEPWASSITNWEELVEGTEPRATGCGPLYDLDNPVDRPNESLAIADMRGVDYAHPHYHANGEVEIYFVLHGFGRVVVGNEVLLVEEGGIVVTPSGTTHYVLPDREQGLVLAVVNTPPFNPANYVDVADTDPMVHYDHELFEQLTQG